MSAAQVLRLAQANGVRFSIDGSDLILDADQEPPTTVLDSIRRHKAEIVALLTTAGTSASAEAAWDPEDWQAFFDERAGVLEFDAGLPHHEAEAQAFKETVQHWLYQNPASASAVHDGCVHCGSRSEAEGDPLLPVLARNGHLWVHAACLAPWRQKMEQEAVATLAGIGIVAAADPPDDFGKNGDA